MHPGEELEEAATEIGADDNVEFLRFDPGVPLSRAPRLPYGETGRSQEFSKHTKQIGIATQEKDSGSLPHVPALPDRPG